MERRRELLPVEVKASGRVGSADIAHLRTFREEHGQAVRGALLLHTGNSTETVAPGILAVPSWRIL